MNRPSLIAVAARRIGTAGQKIQLPKSIATGGAPVEYLYVPCVSTRCNGRGTETLRWVQEVPIVRKTVRLIFYTSDSWNWREAVVGPGCISREQFEADTRCHGADRCRHGYPAGVIPIPRDCLRAGPVGRFFFASREAAEAHLSRDERRQVRQAARKPARIKDLRRAMAHAHPDHGGTTEQFIEARRRYQTALSVGAGEAS
jgi:hypothetical protein